MNFDMVIRAQLEKRRGEWIVIAERSGVSHSWLSKFANHRIPNPGLRTLEKLAAVLSDTPTTQEVA
ncbi:helix-turn-helix domain-containing protein [Comamonas terrigena]|uniref:helix-turn-helix domain-containing protein n=1 Tax=Comamonas terrigena TaxID=32013 RepID=UPI00289D6A16|nr:helix-turn-helix transcriptional regulator [Comamonas terrigena]